MIDRAADSSRSFETDSDMAAESPASDGRMLKAVGFAGRLRALSSRTIPEKHDINRFIELLKRDCTLCVVGALEPLAPVNNMQVAFHRKAVAGSLIANRADTQEVLDFCAKHEIGPDTELINIGEVNDAYDKVEKGDVGFRHVINMASLEAPE